MNKKLKFAIAFAFVLVCGCVTAYASTSSALDIATYYQQYGKYFSGGLNPAYKPELTDGEVKANSASMNVNTEDYVINGKSGFDYPFIRTFNSATSADREMAPWRFDSRRAVPKGYIRYFKCSYDNTVYPVSFRNEQEVMAAGDLFEGKRYSESSPYGYYLGIAETNSTIKYTACLDKPMEINYTDSYCLYRPNSIIDDDNYLFLGNGWRIVKPSITYLYLESDSTYRKRYIVFQDKDGYSCAVILNFKRINDEFVFIGTEKVNNETVEYKFYFVNSNNYDETTQHPNGFEYNFVAESYDGIKYYFYISDMNYTLHGISDRYGNTYITQISEKEISVTDCYGNTYVCDMSGITRINNGNSKEIVKYDTQIINDEIRDPNNLVNIDNEIIFAVTKNSSDNELIQSDEKIKITYFMKQENLFDNMLSSNDYLCGKFPYKVVEPNGLIKTFEYQEFGWNIGIIRDIEYGLYFAVSNYKVQDSEQLYENYNYEASVRSPKNQFSWITGTTAKYINNSAEEKVVSYVVDENGRIRSEYIYGKHGMYSMYKKNVYNYSDGKPWYVTTELCQFGKTGKINRSYGYDSKSSVLTYESDGMNSYTYTHHADNYYLPSTTTYKKDAATTIKIENLLTADGKSIGTENTYENDVLMSTVNYTYDSYGNVASVTKTVDGNRSTTAYSYSYAADGGYTVTETTGGITDADGTECGDIVTSKSYDYRGNLVSSTDANGGTVTMTYDMLDRLLSTQYPDGTSETYSYDIENNTTSKTARNGTVYKNFYDAAGRLKKTCYLDANGDECVTAAYEYDGLGRVAQFRRYRFDTDYTTAKYEYNCLDQITSEKIYNKSDELIKTTKYDYTSNSDSNKCPLITVQQTTEGDGGTYAKNIKTYDYRNNLLTETQKSGTEERTYTYTFDFLNNRLTATDPLGNTETTQYDYASRPISVTNALGGTKTYEYDESGNLISETDFGGNATTYSYDAAERKISVTSPLDDERTALTKTYYDSNGNVIKTAVKSNKKGADETFDITDYSYDCMNNVTSSAVHPTADSTIYTQYEYDSLGNVTRQITGLTELLDDTSVIPEGVSCISNSYDELGRLKRKSDEPTATNFNSNLYIRNRVDNVLIERTPNGNLIQYKYDDFDNLLRVKNGDNVFVENTYDINGKRKTMTDETGTTNYTHNAFGELTTEEKNGTIKAYTYDLAGRRTGFTLSDGGRMLKSLTYNYDALGRMTSVSDGTETTEYAYDENSNLVSRSRGGTVYQTNEYNKASLPERMIFNNSDGTQDIHRYVYSANGNVAAYNSSAVGTHIYEYDLCGRLQKDRFLDSGANRYLDTYVYDSRGNIEQYKHKYYTESDEFTDEMTYSYDISNRIVSGTNGSDSFTYEYDDNGNLLSMSKNGLKTREFVYNKINNLVSSTVEGVMTEYTYNGDRLRETKTTNGITTRHIYNGTDIVADVTGDTTTNFVRGVGLIYSENTATGEKRRYDLNAHGDVVKRKNADGTAENFNYRAYGKAAAGTPDPFGYCGEYTDSETGMVYLRNRYYDPELGRFINVDPVFSGANWYAYCEGNPVNNTDPTGCVMESDNKFGKRSLKYRILVGLGHMWETNYASRDKINSVANEVRKIDIAESEYNLALKQLSQEGLLEHNSRTFTREICDSVTHEDFILSYIAYSKVDEFKHYDSTMPIEISVGNYYDIDIICFVAGTKVLTENGLKDIENIQVGECVYAKNITLDAIELKKVIRVFENKSDVLVNISLENGEVIKTTPTHPFFVVGEGWILAEKLKTTDLLIAFNGNVERITGIGIENLTKPISTYNFEVEDYHNYFVGDSSVLVHNRCLTNKEAQQAAANLGYTQRVGISAYGTWIFSNGKNVISADRTQHGSFGTDRYQWKMADSVSKLAGGKYSTTDEELNIIRQKR